MPRDRARSGAARWLAGAATAALVLSVMVFEPRGAAAATSAEPFGTVERASVSSEGAQGDHRSVLTFGTGPPSAADTGGRAVSGNGRYVAFTSAASNLAGSDTNGFGDVFVHDRSLGTTVAVTGGDRWGTGASIDDAGSRVAFESNAPTWHPGSCRESATRVFVQGTAGGAATHVTPTRLLDEGTPSERCEFGGGWPQLSGDGGTVVFTSGWDYGAGDRNTRGRDEVFVFGVDLGAYEHVSVPVPADAVVAVPGGPAVADFARPRVSGDGTKVLFLSRLDGFHPDVPDGDAWYAYVRDRLSGVTDVASRNSAGVAVPVIGAALSDDGGHVAFATALTDSGAGDTTSVADVFVRDLGVGTTTRVSVRADGGSFQGGARDPAISGDGSVVAFRGIENVNEPEATWVRDLGLGQTFLASQNTTGGLSETGPPSISADGNVVAYQSTATLLIENDTNGREDVFVAARQPCEPFDVTLRASARTASADPPACPLPEVELFALEVTQGVQNLDNQQTIYSDRETWVRAHVRSTAGTIVDQRARLLVRDTPGGALLATLSPFTAAGNGTISVVPSPRRLEPSHSFNFRIPRDLTEREFLSFDVELLDRPVRCRDPGNDCWTIVEIATGARLDAVIYPMSWVTSSLNVVQPTARDLSKAWLQLQGLFPVSELRGSVLPNPRSPVLGDPSTSIIPGVSHVRMLSLAVDAHVLHTPATCQAAGLHPACIGVFLYVGTSDEGLSGMTFGLSDRATVVSLDEDLTVPHEVGHVLGREHTACSGEEAEPDASYPYHKGWIGTVNADPLERWDYFGADVFGSLLRRPHRISSANSGDLMSYCSPTWVSPWTYEHVGSALQARFGVAPRSPSTLRRPAAAGVGALRIVGVVDGTDAAIASVAPTFNPPSAVGTGAVEVRVLDDSGVVLATYAADVEGFSDSASSVGAFVVNVPKHPDAHEIRLVVDGAQRDAVVGSAGAPSIELSTPGASTGWSGGSRPVSWSTSDPDGGPLTVTVEFSGDGGTTFLPLGEVVDGSQLAVDPAHLAASSDARVRVAVTDGFHVATDISDPFVVGDGPPEVLILTEGTSYTPGEQASFEAMVTDADDGRLGGASVVWSSDVDGPVGVGATTTLEVAALSPGSHVLTATATDSSGNASSDSISFEVRPVAAIAHRLAGENRFRTGVAISALDYPARGASAAVLARADVFADALAGTPLAVRVDGPLLLTARDALSPVAADELRRVLPAGATVYLLGGEAALGRAVADAVQALGFTVRRLGGQDRYATAAIIAGELADPDVILLATGRNFPDALAAGTAAGALNGAVVLTNDESTPAATGAYLADHPGVPRYAIGGPAARGQPDAIPLIGTDRYATANLVADTLLPHTVTLGVASGTNFPDALSGGAHLARLGGALLLARPDAVPASVIDALKGKAGRVVVAYLYGGTAALAETVADQVRASLTPAT